MKQQRASLWPLRGRTSSTIVVPSIIVVTTLLLFVTSISTTNASVLRGVHQINNHGNIDSRPTLPTASSSREKKRRKLKSEKSSGSE